MEPAFGGGLAGPKLVGGPAGTLSRATAQGSYQPKTSDRVDISLDGGIIQEDEPASVGRSAGGLAFVGVAMPACAPAPINRLTATAGPYFSSPR
eukprot:4179627-Pyramimonas_sp.AAC.1